MTPMSFRLKRLLVTIALLSFAARAQNQGNANQTQSQPEGWEGYGYVVHQSVDIGYRANDITGSEQMYNTLVNLRSGPRLLDQSLTMQSQNHDGTLFDTCSSTVSGGGAIPTMPFACGWIKTSGMTSALRSGEIKQTSATICWRILSIHPLRVRTFLPRPHRTFSRRAGALATSI